jgi:uncharacterized membrane-anchored protein
MENKKPWLSKTVLVNVVVSLAGILSMLGVVPGVAAWLQGNSDLVLSVLGAVGVGLRFITKDKIVLKD